MSHPHRLVDVGPCARCGAQIVRYGPYGRPLCNHCQETQ